MAARPAVAGSTETGDVAHDAGLQWGFDRIGTVAAWETTRGAGTVIAVVDSGVVLDHEDLAANIVEGTGCQGTGGDPSACTVSPADDDGHGTHVAGVAAARAGNRVGIAGVAQEASIMPIKVLHTSCPGCPASGEALDVVAAIRWATDNGADVINLSLGATTDTVFGPGFGDAVRYAWERGAIPVVAAGNQLVLTADFGDAPAVVVTAIDRDGGVPSYADGVGAARWAITGPGGDAGDTTESCSQNGDPIGILSTYFAEDDRAAYACLSGTSMAAPHVSGALALLRAAGLDPATAVDVLLRTAEDIGEAGADPVFGAGLVDLRAAMAAVPTVTPAAGAPGPLDTGDGAGGSGRGETSAPQPFVTDDGRQPSALLVAFAVLTNAGVAAWLLVAYRRRHRFGT